MRNIPKQLAQQIVESVKDVCEKDINYIMPSGIILASTNTERIGEFHELGQKAASTGAILEVKENDVFFGTQKGINIPVENEGEVIAVIGITGDPDEVRKYAYLALRIMKLLIREQELESVRKGKQEKNSYIVRSLVGIINGNAEFLSNELGERQIKMEQNYHAAVIRLNKRYNPVNISMIESKIHKLCRSMNLELFSYEYPYEFILLFPKDETSYLTKLKKFSKEQSIFIKTAVGNAYSLAKLSYS